MAGRYYETTRRSITKSLTFRVLVIISDLIVVYLVTHKVDLAVTVMITTNIASMTLYFFHERIWNGVKWGKAQRK